MCWSMSNPTLGVSGRPSTQFAFLGRLKSFLDTVNGFALAQGHSASLSWNTECLIPLAIQHSFSFSFSSPSSLTPNVAEMLQSQILCLQPQGCIANLSLQRSSQADTPRLSCCHLSSASAALAPVFAPSFCPGIFRDVSPDCKILRVHGLHGVLPLRPAVCVQT